jgi:Tfp pilus assembly protein FimT
MTNRRTQHGFTLIEVLVIVAIMGMTMILMLPSIMNSLETRDLENSTRDIQTTLQQARYRSVNEKIHHRVRFSLDHGRWEIRLESMDAAGTWTEVPGFPARPLSQRFVITLNLPASQAVEFSPVGIVEGYDSTHNTVTLQSTRLKAKRQPDLRVLTIFGGGTIRYVRAASA